MYEQLAQCCYATLPRVGFEPATYWSQVQRSIPVALPRHLLVRALSYTVRHSVDTGCDPHVSTLLNRHSSCISVWTLGGHRYKVTAA